MAPAKAVAESVAVAARRFRRQILSQAPHGPLTRCSISVLSKHITYGPRSSGAILCDQHGLLDRSIVTNGPRHKGAARRGRTRGNGGRGDGDAAQQRTRGSQGKGVNKMVTRGIGKRHG
jgi:hypothetical protein